MNWLLNLNYIYKTHPFYSEDWGKKWLVDFNAGKSQLVLLDWYNNICSIDVKMDGSVLIGKISFQHAAVDLN